MEQARDVLHVREQDYSIVTSAMILVNIVNLVTQQEFAPNVTELESLVLTVKVQENAGHAMEGDIATNVMVLEN